MVFITVRSFALIVVSLAALIVFGLALIQAALRSRVLPVCWHCGARAVFYSGTRHSTDTVARFLLLVPYRCRGCQYRFYAFRTHRPLPQP